MTTDSIDITFRIIFISQTVLGVLGNSTLLGLNIFSFLTGHKLKPINLLLTHFVFVNNVVLLSKGIPLIIAAFGVDNFLDDNGCKLAVYFHRVAQGLSLCTTSLLSCFQAITIKSRSSKWADFKATVPKFIILSCFLFWVLNLLINGSILVYIRGPRKSRNTTKRQEFIYCSSSYVSGHISIFVIMNSFFDLVCMGTMIWSSISMVLILHRHHQQIQYIRSNNFTPGGTPETRATQAILLLVSIFVSFYVLNSIMTCYMSFSKPTPWIVYTSAFLASCFPTYSPFVLVLSDSQPLKYCVAFWQRIKLLF
ncbi:vomeronasal type-1 receptor 4-like [Phascolarctos cinereus]|uniref:Vomeronasal type-1 receptor n=1 Tax=Phascolarctos cinereus TaxID=38626 RepID=A0A6P5JKB1_PHACI|nr:vomeronasal type-1 receptor 4-like [Phascolarctos cinereus]